MLGKGLGQTLGSGFSWAFGKAFGQALIFNLGYSKAESIPAVGPGWYLFTYYLARLLLNAWEQYGASHSASCIKTLPQAKDTVVAESQVKATSLAISKEKITSVTGRLDWPAITLVLAVVASLGGAYLARVLGEIVPLSGASVLVGWGFMLGGAYARQRGGFESFVRMERPRDLGIVVALVLIWPLCVWFADINIGSNIYRGPLVLVFGRAWCGLVLVCVSAVLIEHHLPLLCRLLTWVGQHSLAIYVAHSIELTVFSGLLATDAFSSLRPFNWAVPLALRLITDLALGQLLYAVTRH